MSSFTQGSQAVPSIPLEGTYEIQTTPTYLLARDEDCENSFHSTADFVSTDNARTDTDTDIDILLLLPLILILSLTDTDIVTLIPILILFNPILTVSTPFSLLILLIFLSLSLSDEYVPRNVSPWYPSL